ncbi:uncharacterized protein LOC111285532 [Durio zibethinus]|uniref:Uncharacterized protein LOC111285532 n=1 Tax=Durio zibethinus TaxID=66656 RepID=A0A6P5XSC6_DURZI|nr:uncharacterized protein LOC111285532 [Durio zibethinus]
MEEADSADVASPSRVCLSSFSPCPRRLSTYFPQPRLPVVSSSRRLAWVSLQGCLVNAEEASSARAIGGGLSREEALAWELFNPIERFLIVAVIGVATVESKKNRLLCQLKKSVELRDQVLSSFQQKVENLCEQLNNAEEKHGTGPKTKVESPLNETFGSGIVKFVDCGCWICDQHREQLKGNSMMKTSGGNEMPQYNMALPNEAEQEERRMSDLSDWASSVTSASEIQLNNLAIEQDIFNFKRDCEEKDAVIRELTTFAQSSNIASSKRISELEDIIRRKSTIITRLKKDMLVLEQKVVHLTRLQRPSSSTSSPNCWQTPVMTDNVLYDMDSTTSPSSSDSDCSPKNCPQALVPTDEEVDIKREQKSSPAKVSSSFMRQTEWHSKSRPATPLKEISTNHKPNTPSSRPRQVSAIGKSNRIWRQAQNASKVSTTKKRWT